MRVLAWPSAAVLALAFAGLALAGLTSRLLDSRAETQRAQRLSDFGTLTWIAARESRLVATRRTDESTAARIQMLLRRLERSSSSALEMGSVVVPAVNAVALAEHGSPKRAAAAYARVHQAAERAALQEAGRTRSDRSSTLARLEDWSTVLAAVLGAMLGIALVVRRLRPTPAAVVDTRVEELSLQARTDSLTGLGNHRAFNETISAAIAERTATNTPFVLLAMDLDGLKRINDNEGHLAGDAHIKLVADTIRSVVGDCGTVHRTGGDEFMVVLPGRRNWDGLALARQIEEETRKAAGRRALSIGITESTGTEGRHLLVGQADLALYEAKRTRLNAVVFNPGLAKPGLSAATEPSGPVAEQRALAAALAKAVDAKDVGTQSHCETVAELSVAIGERLGIKGAELERLRLAGLLHDVGKIGVADAILQKPYALDEAEREAMTGHVEIGHSIMLAAELAVEAEWVLYHHERYDGAGYPEGRRAGEIPLPARVIAVADAYEAMTSDRPYRPRVGVAEAIAELQAHSGTQFDGRCVNALVEVIAASVGTDLELKSTPEPRLPALRVLPGGATARVA